MNINEASEQIAEHGIKIDMIERDWKNRAIRMERKMNSLMIVMMGAIFGAFALGCMI